jgi:predicted secreted protein
LIFNPIVFSTSPSTSIALSTAPLILTAAVSMASIAAATVFVELNPSPIIPVIKLLVVSTVLSI